MHWGHLSGEWVVGGSEAKVFAYAAAFLGLSCFLNRALGWGWVWMGIASAFHVLTGAWLVVASFVVLGLEAMIRNSNVRRQGLNDSTFLNCAMSWCGLLVGGIISLFGLLPAMRLNHGTSLAEQDRGAIIYVFQRLPHHLVPSRFAVDRWLAFALLIVATVLIVRLVRRSSAKTSVATISENSDVNSEVNFLLHSMRIDQYAVLIRFAAVFLLIAAIGVLIDLSFSSWATNWSASLLRYYWFRWNDVIWPTVLVVSLLLVIENSGPFITWARFLALATLIISGTWVVGVEYIKNYSDSISPADQAALMLRGQSRVARVQIHRDWLDMCAFISSNTPEDSLFLTPRFQQTFKWNAARAEVVCWKDSPQDALGLIEWESRMLAAFPSNADGYGMPWSDSLLSKLQKEYEFDYVLIDRRLQKTPPVLEFIQSNSTYALFRTIKLDSNPSR